ncbi:MAG: VWA-like domain-containing protein [Polyangiales bacterium]
MTPRSDIDVWLDAFVRAPVFLARYPFYAAVLGQLTPVADPSVKRMAVSLEGGGFYLHVNVDAFLREPQYLLGVLLHEVHHVVLGHLTHPRFHGLCDVELMDLAIEMSANEYIEEPLPDPITWRPYASIGLRAGQSTLERYERLVAAFGEGTVPASGGSGREQGAGERADDHRYLRRGDTQPGALEQTRQLIQRAAVEAGELRAGGGDDTPGALCAGKDPGSLIEALTGVLGRAERYLDWKTALRMFVARARAPVHTYARPNRRFPSRVGEVPGRTYSPRVLVKPRLLVVIDTSMSMTRPELAEIARQLGELAQHATLTVAECDTRVARVYAWSGALTNVMGRGGTDLRPVFAGPLLAAHGVEGVIYFTDGDGPTPDTPPSVPVLWILTKPEAFTCPWGERAWLGRAPLQRTPQKRATRGGGARGRSAPG